MKTIISILVFFLSLAVLRPASHFVKAGNPTPIPPYLTWATASDSIQKCINAAQAGDTVFVGNGIYKELIKIKEGVTLIGSGWDSCIIDGRQFNVNGNLCVVRLFNNCTLSGFHVYGMNPKVGTCIYADSFNVYVHSLIENNLVENSGSAIFLDFGAGIVRNNICRNGRSTISVSNNDAFVEDNIITTMDYGIWSDINSIATFRDNYITTVKLQPDNPVQAITCGWSWINCFQNIKIRTNSSRHYGMDLYSDDTVSNCSIYGVCEEAISFLCRDFITNTSLSDGNYGIVVQEPSFPKRIQYNNVWKFTRPYRNHTPDSTNISANPMFVEPDTMNFHLQKFSPLIDRGDPALNDPDEKRSDIGSYGGPFGESYPYMDMPPSSPVNLTAAIDSGLIRLGWNINSEADFSHYILFRDTVSSFPLDSTKIIGTTPNPFFNDPLLPQFRKLYYKLVAVDNQGLKSAPGKEISALISGSNDYQFPDNYSYCLYANYPNPFNSSTVIRFRIKDQGRVSLKLFSLNGELISTIKNDEYGAGYHEEPLSMSTVGRELASGMYLIVLTAYDSRAAVAFRDIIKIIYLK